MSLNKMFIPILIMGLMIGGIVAYLGVNLSYQSLKENYEHTISTLEQENANLDSRITEVEEQITAHEIQNTDLQGNLSHAQSLIIDLGEQLSDQAIRNIELESTLGDLLNITLTQHFQWNFGTTTFHWNISLPFSIYLEYLEKPRPTVFNWAYMALDSHDDSYLSQLIQQINAGSATLTNLEKVNYVAAFVQSLANTEDNFTIPGDGHPQYPIETLLNHGGDSEDNSILVAGLLEALGYDTALLILPNENHVAVGIYIDGATGYCYEYKGREYYYLETTGNKWTIGELPSFTDPTAYVHPLEFADNEVVTGARDGEVIVWKYVYGTFENVWSTHLSNSISDIEIGDVNNDGANEVVVSTNGRTGAGVHLFENISGTFVETWNDTTTFSTSIDGLAIGDVDNDGTNEFVVSDYWATTKVYKYNSGAYEVIGDIVFYYGGNVNDVIIADSDNDGYNELLIARSFNVLYEHYRQVEVFEYESKTFVNVANVSTPNTVDSIDVDDTDGDNLNELVVSGFFNYLQLYEYDNGEYVNIWTSVDLGNIFQDSEIGDVTNDGKNDVVGHMYISPQSDEPGQTIIWEWSGSDYVNTFNVTHSAGQGSMHVLSIDDVDSDDTNEWSVNEGTKISLWRIVEAKVTRVWISEIGESPHAEIGDVDNDAGPVQASPIYAD